MISGLLKFIRHIGVELEPLEMKPAIAINSDVQIDGLCHTLVLCH